MTLEIINFDEAKRWRDADPNCRMAMPDGKRYMLFSVNYRFAEDGAAPGVAEAILSAAGDGNVKLTTNEWSFEIWAQSQEEAEQRLQAIKSGSTSLVQICASGIF